MYIDDLWYFVMPGRALKAGRLYKRMLLERPLVFGRARDGRVFALRDACPHRGMPLSYGRFDGEQIECCYHGWRFDTSGACTDIPCLSETQRFDTRRICVPDYPCREVQGNIWVYMGERREGLPAIPALPDVAARGASIWLRMPLECDIDYAALGLIDPAHTPYVHHSPIWRSPGVRHDKQKHFVPSRLGFIMARHTASSNSTAYRILGATPEVEIDFQLPGVRIEHIEAGRHQFCGMTVVTPITAEHTEIHHLMYWNIPWLSALRPLIWVFTRYFLNQDRVAMRKLGQGLAYNPRPMFVREPDAQARWYFSLKSEYQQALQEGREFSNPLQEQTLNWRT